MVLLLLLSLLASLDQLVHSYLGSKSTCFDAAKRSLIADSSALSNQDVLTSYSVAALGFSGDLNAMESELNALIEKKRSIQLEQSRVYKQVCLFISRLSLEQWKNYQYMFN